MGYLKAILAFGVVVASIEVSSGDSSENHSKEECPRDPPGLTSFTPCAGTRLYYAWSTLQGTAKKAFLQNPLCREKDIWACSCVGYDVVGYEENNENTQEGLAFSVNKEEKSADLYHFKRLWTKSGDYHERYHYDRDFQFHARQLTSMQERFIKFNNISTSFGSYRSVWTYADPTPKDFASVSSPFKVLSWTSTEVVFYDCDSKDPDIRVFTTYVPNSNSTDDIPFPAVFDTLKEVGIDTSNLLWYKIDHDNCVYPNATVYPKLLSKN